MVFENSLAAAAQIVMDMEQKQEKKSISLMYKN